MEQAMKEARWVKAAAVLMVVLTLATAAFELWMLNDLEQLTQQTETALRSPSTDVQAFRSLAASALDGAQGMTRIALAGMLIAIGACAISAVVLFSVSRRLSTGSREDKSSSATGR
jgi:hypothetical protein